MDRVTDFREVDYIVPFGTDLPKEIAEYLKLYVGEPACDPSSGKPGIKYTIPIYMMQEWFEKFLVDPPPSSRLIGG